MHGGDNPFRVPQKLFSASRAARTLTAGSSARGDRRRQIDVTAVRKLKITQLDTAAPTLDHKTGSDRETVWQAHSSSRGRTHETLLGM